MNAQIRNVLAEAVAILGILQGAIPSFTAISHVPAWVGPTVALMVAVGNRLIQDNTPHPTASTQAEVTAASTPAPK